MSFHNEEQKAACLSSYTGEEALAAGFSPSFAVTNCTPPRAVVGLSLKMMWLSHSLWNVVSFLKVSTPPSVVIRKILRENIRFASVERLLLWLVPLFSFFLGGTWCSIIQPCSVWAGAAQTPQLCSEKLWQVLVAEGAFCFLQPHWLCSSCGRALAHLLISS